MLKELQINHDSPTPVYRQIADAVRVAALDGRIRPGDRLPPTRDLARQLGVNRQTVVAAYEFLATEGRVHSHTGKYPGGRLDIKNRIVATTLFQVRRLLLELDGIEPSNWRP